jgi:hypothetical protein
MRSTGLITPSDIYASRQERVYEIGYRDHINETYGLMDGSGAQLQRVLEEYGQETSQSWLDFDTAYELAEVTTGMMSGAAWYHWTAIRGVQNGMIWVANSAPGYKGIYDHVGRSDWDRLGAFSCVWLT